MTWAEILDSRVLQAVVAGVFLASGWMVNGAQNRRLDRRRRAEKLRDAHRAIYAEIASYLTNLGSRAALETYRDKLAERMRVEPGYVPLIPTERNDTIFRALVEEIHILPRVTIDPIVTYYNQLFAIEALIADMRDPGYAALDPDRRIAIYEDYIALKVQALADGEFALKMIAAFAEGGHEMARKAAEGVNIRGEGPSDP